MKILLINPTCTDSMTQKAVSAASKVARAKTETIAVASRNGPTSIEGLLDVSMCQSALVEEAAYHATFLLYHRFSKVTTLSHSFASISNNLNNYGLTTRCANVQATDIPVPKLAENNP